MIVKLSVMVVEPAREILTNETTTTVKKHAKDASVAADASVELIMTRNLLMLEKIVTLVSLLLVDKDPW
jgi:hypothetical protein